MHSESLGVVDDGPDESVVMTEQIIIQPLGVGVGFDLLQPLD